MATQTPNLGLAKPDPGGDDDAWAAMLNGNADILDGAVHSAQAAAAAAQSGLAGKVDVAAISAYWYGILVAANAAQARAGLGVLSADILIGCSFEWSGPNLPLGFLWEDGANVSRATYAALFAAIGITYGPGDGSTTFTLPDSRGRVAVGRDNMGGSSAGRLSGVLASTSLGAAGGDQWLQSHAHGVNDPTHAHGVADAGHGHGVNDPGHAHGVSDPGHAHLTANAVVRNLGSQVTNISVNSVSGGTLDPNNQVWTDTRGTGIGIHGAGTGIWLSASGTGIGIHGNYTGISIQAAGSGSGQNVQPSIVKNKIIFTGVFA